MGHRNRSRNDISPTQHDEGTCAFGREGDATCRPLHNFSIGRDTKQHILSELDRHKKALAEIQYPLRHTERHMWTHCGVQINP